MRSERSPEPTWPRRSAARAASQLLRARCRRAGCAAPPSPWPCCGAASGLPASITTMPVGRWVMRIADSVLLTCWPPAPLRAHGVDLQVVVVDRDVDLLGLRQHRDGRGRGVDAARRLGVRHALHAMHAGFEFQLGEGAAAADLGDDFLVAADRAFARRDDFDLPALLGGIALVHAEQDRRRTARPRRRRCRRGFRG